MKFGLIVFSLTLSMVASANKDNAVNSLNCLMFKNDKLVVTNGILSTVTAGYGTSEVGAPFNFHERIDKKTEKAGFGAYLKYGYDSKGNVNSIKASIIDTGNFWSYSEGSKVYASHSFDKFVKDDIAIKDDNGHKLLCRVNRRFTMKDIIGKSFTDPNFDLSNTYLGHAIDLDKSVDNSQRHLIPDKLKKSSSKKSSSTSGSTKQ